MDLETETGSWCIELWNQSDAILKNNAESNTQSDTYLRFFKDVAQMHNEIAKKYKKTVNNYMPKKKSSNEDPTQYVAFIDMLNSFNSMAGVHEKMSAKISTEIIQDYKSFVDSSVSLNNKQTKTRSNILKHMDEFRKRLEASWIHYITAYKNKQKALESNNKAQSDDTLARQEQNKYEAIYRMKEKEYTDQELNYATQVKKYNESRLKSISGNILNLISTIEEQEDLRSKKTINALNQMAEAHKSSFDQLASVTNLINESANKINFEKDINLMIKKLKNDELFPVDLPFLSLNKCTYLEGTVKQLYNYMVGLNEEVEHKVHKTSFAASLFKKSNKKDEVVNLSNPFIDGLGIKNVKLDDLTVLQIFKKNQELQRIIQNAENEKEASNKMIELYTNDSSLGDLSLVTPRLQMVQRKLYSLFKLKALLEERYNSLGGDPVKMKMEQKLESIYSNFTDVTGSPDSVESSIYEFEPDESDDNDDTGIESNSNASHPYSGSATGPREALPLPPLLTLPKHVAVGFAKYEYPGNGEFYLPCQMNEKFYIVAKDDSATGWTEVVNNQGTNGFVPTQYLELHDPEQ